MASLLAETVVVVLVLVRCWLGDKDGQLIRVMMSMGLVSCLYMHKGEQLNPTNTGIDTCIQRG